MHRQQQHRNEDIPEVIDDELLRDALELKEEDDLLDAIEEAKALKLSFRKLSKIANLECFEGLRKLCLDNNAIETMENLGHMVNLVWLDLSFNKLETIQGLEKLTKLTDLSLCNNRIKEVGGLDENKDIQCLSLGNNMIAGSLAENVGKLRRLRRLQLLTLQGNPLAKESEYRAYVLAYLNKLTYLDYSMIVPSEMDAAREQYHTELLEVEDRETFENEKIARELAAAKQSADLEEANLAYAETIFDDLFEEDKDYFAKIEKRLASHHGGLLDEHYNSFHGEVDAASDAFLQNGQAQNEQKKAEKAAFEEKVYSIRLNYAEKSREKIEEFERQKKRALRAFAADPEEKTVFDSLRSTLDKLYFELMGFEMKQVSEFEQAMDAYENSCLAFKTTALESQQGYFRQIEEHENTFHKDLMQLVNDILDKAAKQQQRSAADHQTAGEDDDEEGSSSPHHQSTSEIELGGGGDIIDDDDTTASGGAALSLLLADRDSYINAVTSSHDIHVSTLFKIEDLAKNKEEKRCKTVIKTQRDEEQTRNRERVMEITAFKQGVLNELDDLLVSQQVVEENDS